MTDLIVGVVDRRCNKPRQEKRMSIVTARCAVLAAAVALSACSGGKPAGQFASNEAGGTDAIHGSSTAHGKAGMVMKSTGDPDTDFLRGMIPHHEGAVEMARAEIANGTDPKIRAMAQEVIRAQQAEIQTMQTWLAERQAAKKEAR